MAVIPVDIAGAPYEVRVGTGLLATLAEQCSGRLRKRRVPIVTDARVHQAWGAVVEQALHGAGHEAVWRILPPGEASKSWEQLSATVDWLLAEEVERGDHVLALGGVQPGLDTLASGRYPHAKVVYLVTRGQPTGALAEAAQALTGRPAAQVLASIGCRAGSSV